jgi:hypothetical protein
MIKLHGHHLAILVIALICVSFVFIALFAFSSVDNTAGRKSYEPAPDDSLFANPAKANLALYLLFGILAGAAYYMLVARTKAY